MFSYPGNIHIHSIYSDGTGNPAEISAAAAAAGLSYIIITDHETLDGYHEEAIRNGVVVLIGTEINRSCNHYLALGIDSHIASNDLNPQEVIDRVRDSGGLGFIAHPFERGSRFIEKGKAYPWINWPVFNFNGIEIWNYSSYWRGLHPSLFKTIYWFFFNRKGALRGPSRRLLRLWDCYNMHGHRITAIGGTDAHAYLYRLGLLRQVIFSYRYIFTTINTYVVLERKMSDSFQAAKKQILNALRDGCCYIAFDSLYPGRGFSFRVETVLKNIHMGGEVAFSKDLTIRVTAPGRLPLIRLICDGRVIDSTSGNILVHKPSGPGVYRAEVYHRPMLGRPRPWIYSNPIFIRPA